MSFQKYFSLIEDWILKGGVEYDKDLCSFTIRLQWAVALHRPHQIEICSSLVLIGKRETAGHIC